jgi:acetyltransferase-like isoleucine patch superfamily enzyme
MRRIVNKIIAIGFSFYWQNKGIRFNGRLRLFGLPIVTIKSGGQIIFGDNVTLVSNSRFTAMGVKHAMILRALTHNASIEIGNNSGFSGTTICAATSIKIGSDCLVGADVSIVDTDFHPIEPINRRNAHLELATSKPVVIGNNVFIGAGSIVLKGVTIGDNAVIGAHSVVTKDIPANVIASGNPCRTIRKLNM